MLLTFIELFREVKMNSWKMLSSQRPKVTTDCLKPLGRYRASCGPQTSLPSQQLDQQLLASDHTRQKESVVRSLVGEKMEDGRKSSNFTKLYDDTKLVVTLTQGAITV